MSINHKILVFGLLLGLMLFAVPLKAVQAASPHLRPSCDYHYITTSASPGNFTTNKGYGVSENVTWLCSTLFPITIVVGWGDGNYNTWTCAALCGTGNHTFPIHYYQNVGNYTFAVSTTNQGDNASATYIIHIIPPCIGPPTYC